MWTLVAVVGTLMASFCLLAYIIFLCHLRQTAQLERPARQARAGFSDLPLEIVLEIATFLPHICQLCLALTCKSLMEVLDGSKTLQRSPDLRHPRELPLHLFFIKRRRHIFRAPRWELLRQLEDSRWRCCSGCLKLHPIHEFSAHDLAIDAEERTCMFGPLVGIVRLCPCIQMTFREKLKLVERLSSSQAEPSGCKTRAAVVLDLDAPDEEGSCWHQCSYSYNSGFATIQRKLKPILEENDDFLIESSYIIRGDNLPSNFSGTTVLCCPHRRIFDHMHDLLDLRWEKEYSSYRSPGSNDVVYCGVSKRPMACQWCQTTIFDARWCIHQPSTREDSCTFTTRRRLGKGTNRADNVWYEQTEVAFEVLDFDEQEERRPFKSWLQPGQF
jgi:hypothetical protein